MKKNIVAIIAVLLNVYSADLLFAGNVWTQKAIFGGSARSSAVGFSIGSKGYIGTGYGDSGYGGSGHTKDFWEYDAAADAWTQKADFGGTARSYAVGFSIGSRGYVGTGSDGSHRKDFWEYDPATNKWTEKTVFAGTARYGAVGFSIGGKGYVGTGNSVSGHARDFWEYDPVADGWTRKADFGGEARYFAAGFSTPGRGYIGTGYNVSFSNTKDFWEYDPDLDAWTQKAGFGGTARAVAAGFSIGGKGYIGTGHDGSDQKDLWEYDPLLDVWAQRAGFGGAARSFAVGFAIGNRGYIGTGTIYSASTLLKDFFAYEPPSTTPSPFSFSDRTGVARATIVTSNAVTVAGIDIATPISIVGGTYSINGGPFTGAAGTVKNGDTVAVRQTSSANYATATDVTLTIGGISDTFSVTTQQDTTGGQFNFVDQTGAALGAAVTSNPITVSWIGTSASISIAGGAYSINGGLYTSAVGTVSSGNTVTVRQTAAASHSTTTDATLTIGAASDTFSVTTLHDTVPDPFAFIDRAGVARSAVTTSNAITVTGITAATPISIAGGAYAINGGSYTDAAGSVKNGDTVTVRQTSSSVHSTTTEATLTIGGVHDTFSVTTKAGNAWTLKAPFGGNVRRATAAFSIGSRGYIATGFNNYFQYDCWAYDPVADAWTGKARFAGTERRYAVGFSIGDKGYLGTGSLFGGSLQKDFWEYDPALNAWTQKADFGGAARDGAVGFSIGGRGYVGTGYTGGHARDFWEYDPLNNGWTQRADFGGAARNGAVGFSIGGRGYVGTGNSASGPVRDFWEYDPAADRWTRRADFGGTARAGAAGFSIGSSGFIGTGHDGSYRKDFWEYDPFTDLWMQREDFGGTARNEAAGFSIGGAGFIGTGLDAAFYQEDFWEYEPAGTTPSLFGFSDRTGVARGTIITSNSVTVAGINAATPISIAGGSYAINGGSYTGAAGTVNHGDSVTVRQTSSANYATTTDLTLTIGGISDTFSVTTQQDTTGGQFNFVDQTGAALGAAVTSNPITVSWIGTSASISIAGGAYSINGGLYTSAVGTIGKGDTVTVKQTAAASHSTTTDATLTIGAASDTFSVTTLYDTFPDPFAFIDRNDVARSTITTSNAITVTGIDAATPVSIAGGAYAINGGAYTSDAGSVKSGDTVTVRQTSAAGYSTTTEATLTIGGTSAKFRVTTKAPYTWTPMADLGGEGRYLAVGFSINGRGYVGTGGGSSSLFTKGFWEYDPAGNTWTQKADFGGNGRHRAVGFAIGGKGYLGTGTDGTGETRDFWEYDPALNAWMRKADFGGDARFEAVGFSIGGKGYIGLGTAGDHKTDFWQYDPGLDAWTRKADFGGAGRSGAVGFSIGGIGYVGAGYNKTDFWQYDPALDRWTRKADFGGQWRRWAVGFSIGGIGYLGTGLGESSSPLRDFWEYDPTLDTWKQRADFGGTARYGATGFSTGRKGYIGTGYDGSYAKDFWEYDPIVATDVVPDPFSFAGVADAPLKTPFTSNAITVTGINDAAPIAVSGGGYSINGGTYTSAGGTVNPYDSVTVLQTSSANYATKTDVTLTIGGVSATFRVTTVTPPGDLNGDALVDLADAVVALRVVAGLVPAEAISRNADVDDNGRVGLTEAIYIMQTIAGMR